MKKYEVVIVGGGIAGLATAEMFARSGLKTLLLEKQEKLCMETSGLHHEWFHFGSLYAILPQTQFFRTLVGGIEDVLDYYRDFNGMNLRIDGEGKLVKINRQNAWFRQDNLVYAIATTNDNDFSLRKAKRIDEIARKMVMKLSWGKAIKRFVSRHNRFYKYDWRRGCASRWIPRAGWFDYSEEHLQNFENDELTLASTHISMQSYDCPMNAYSIISDLTKSLISNGGEFLSCAKFLDYRKKSNRIEVVYDNGTIATNRLILASGKALQEQSKERIKVKSVLSPLLVVAPAVCSSNIVRLTPFMDQTINHLKHSVEGREYSLIGGGYFAPPNDGEAIRRASHQLLEKAQTVFPKMADAKLTRLYFSTKSEILSSKARRNYLYKIDKIERDVYTIVPGKFSLAFSLAVNTFKEVMGRCPQTYTSYHSDLDVDGFIAPIKHKSIMKEFLQSQFDTRRSPRITVVSQDERELVS